MAWLFVAIALLCAITMLWTRRQSLASKLTSVASFTADAWTRIKPTSAQSIFVSVCGRSRAVTLLSLLNRLQGYKMPGKDSHIYISESSREKWRRL